MIIRIFNHATSPRTSLEAWKRLFLHLSAAADARWKKINVRASAHAGTRCIGHNVYTRLPAVPIPLPKTWHHRRYTYAGQKFLFTRIINQADCDSFLNSSFTFSCRPIIRLIRSVHSWADIWSMVLTRAFARTWPSLLRLGPCFLICITIVFHSSARLSSMLKNKFRIKFRPSLLNLYNRLLISRWNVLTWKVISF